MIIVGLVQLRSRPPAGGESAGMTIATHGDQLTGLALVAVCLRAFASGCTALTGVEAVSNGVPNFRKPKSANAAGTLAMMAGLTIRCSWASRHSP